MVKKKSVFKLRNHHELMFFPPKRWEGGGGGEREGGKEVKMVCLVFLLSLVVVT